MYYLLSDKLELMTIKTPKGFKDKPESPLESIDSKSCLRVNDIPL